MGSWEGWIPIRVGWESAAAQVDWILLGDQRFTHPFFEDTIQEALRHPFHQAFRRTSGMEALQAWYQERRGLPPQGFVFHMSRCGSTLLSQVLARVESNIVLSEPPPVDSILRGHQRNPALTADRRAEELRWILSALGQQRHPAEERIFVKFDCWSVAELPAIRLAFPDVPWIFVYRDPLEVLASQLRQRALWCLPGGLDPTVFGLKRTELADLPLDEYCSRLLGRICEIALHHLEEESGGVPVNYSELPQYCFSGMLRHFRLDPVPHDLNRMRQAAAFNSKTPTVAFEADGDEKQQAVTNRMRELAHRWIDPVYNQLEAKRHSLSARVDAASPA